MRSVIIFYLFIAISLVRPIYQLSRITHRLEEGNVLLQLQPSTTSTVELHVQYCTTKDIQKDDKK